MDTADSRPDASRAMSDQGPQSPQVPIDPPTLLPGPSARRWQKRALFSLIGALAISPLMPLGSRLPPPTNIEIILPVFVVGFGLACYSVRAYIGSYAATRREQAAGYTTLFGRNFRHLYHLDEKTGEVIRRPNATR